MPQVKKTNRKRNAFNWLWLVIFWGGVGVCASQIYSGIHFFLLIICTASICLLHFLILHTSNPIFYRWRTTMWGVVASIAFLSFLLLNYQNFLNWKWVAGEKNGESIVLTTGKSWSENHPVIIMHSDGYSENDNANLPWSASLDFPNDSVTVLFSRRVLFYVTQPKRGLIQQGTLDQYLPPKSGDGVITKFSYFLNDVWHLAQTEKFDAINDPSQRKWHKVEVFLPPNVNKLSIQVLPIGTDYNDLIWISPGEIIYSFPASLKIFLHVPLLLAWSLFFGLSITWVQRNIEQKQNLPAIYTKNISFEVTAVLLGFFSSFAILHNFSNYWQWSLGIRAVSLIVVANLFFAIYYSFAIYWQANLSSYPRSKIVLGGIISFIAAVFTAFVIPITASPATVLQWKPLSYFVYFADILAIWALLLTVGIHFSRTKASAMYSVSDNRIHWTLLALPGAMIWTIWLLTFWPGIMNGDTYVQWQEILTGKLDDWIPPLVIIFSGLVTRVWHTPGAIAFAQVLATSAVLGWGLATLAKNGLPKYVVITCAILLPLLPANSTSVILIGKDLPYSVSFLALTIILFEIVVSDGEWITNVKAMILLVVASSLVSLFRHNGIVPAIGSILFAGLFFRQYWKNILLAAFCTAAIWGIVNGPIYDLLKVTKGTQPGFPILLHHYEAHVSARTPLSDDEKVFLNNIRPLSQKWTYNPYDVEGFQHPFYNFNYLVEHPQEAKKIFISLSLRDIPTTVKHVLTSSSLIWQITTPEKSCPVYASLKGGEGEPWCNYSYIPEDPNKIVTYEPAAPEVYPRTSFIPFLRLPLYRWVKGWQNPDYVWITWRPALYLYLLIFGGILFALRNKSFKIVIVLMPALLHSAFMILSTLAQHFRYQYPVYLVSVFLIGWLFIGRDRKLKSI